MESVGVNATDILVDTPNPEALDETIQSLGAALVQSGTGYAQVDGHYVARVFGDPGFFEFSVTSQGYATVVRRLDVLL